MRGHLFVLLFVLCTQVEAVAQQYARIYLFDSYVQSQVKLKNRSITAASVNYDAANKVMLFKQGDDIMEFTNLSQIDTIKIDGRKFIPAGKGFYEVVCTQHGTIYIDWLLKDVNIGSKGALGATTQGSVHNLQMTDFELSAKTYTPYQRQSIGSTDVYRRKNGNVYSVHKDGKIIQLKTLKHLLKAYPAFADQIQTYAKEHELDMREVPDALALIDFCMGLSN